MYLISPILQLIDQMNKRPPDSNRDIVLRYILRDSPCCLSPPLSSQNNTNAAAEGEPDCAGE